MYSCIFTYMYICMYIYIYTYMYIYTHTHTHTRTHTYAHTYIYIHMGCENWIRRRHLLHLFRFTYATWLLHIHDITLLYIKVWCILIQMYTSVRVIVLDRTDVYIYIKDCVSQIQPVALGVSFNLNLQSQSPWSRSNGTW